ncbi:hypothetical protein J6590_068644 [Homalodisca vitripennis]|nr:hypothetical protein J6590_068644 [Homalodisca vitripennis]
MALCTKDEEKVRQGAKKNSPESSELLQDTTGKESGSSQTFITSCFKGEEVMMQPVARSRILQNTSFSSAADGCPRDGEMEAVVGILTPRNTSHNAGKY